MNLKEQAIQLKGMLELLKFSDQISKKQIELLFRKIEEIIKSIDSEYSDDDVDWDQVSHVETKKEIAEDDLPF